VVVERQITVYAIFEIGGTQVKATPNSVVRVPRMDAEVGGRVTLDKVLVWSDGDSVEVGQPFVEGKAVSAEVVRHGKDDKVIVFKKKRRKGYRRTRGHRQQFTEIRLTDF
jgi:large subunit ribosomal protein L21